MATDERPTLGGRTVDGSNVNNGLLRCPRCTSRLVSKCGELYQRVGSEASLWVPQRPSAAAAAGEDPADDAWEWTATPYEWWWHVGSMDDVDNLGLSRVVRAPRGPLKLAMCVECNYGPVGYQLEGDARLWLACDLLHQQDAALADDAADFEAPANIDMNMLQGMIASGMAIVRYHVTFDAQRLGMCLADAADGQGVEVVAFTDAGDGQLGPAELSGQVTVGDKLARINGRSTSGLDYAAVLDMVIEAPRPVTIHFERKGAQPPQPAPTERIVHTEWRGPPSPTKAATEAAPAAAAPVVPERSRAGLVKFVLVPALALGVAFAARRLLAR